jgi:nucleotidyltransferase/DNA polymerase involved in DNA repair
MDAFFASVEVLDNPSLKGKPVIVGAPHDKRGVVSTASYEARKFGVRSAMPSRTAFKLCPKGIFLPVRMSRYCEISEHVMAILESFTPVIEPVSIDEAFADVRGALRKWGDAVAIAKELKKRIRKQTGLTASVGVAPNKFLAKLASDLEKPDGLTIVPSGDDAIAAFLAPLPVTRIWGVGKVSAAQLEKFGIRTIADLQRRSLAELQALVGKAMAAHIHELAFGRDDRPVITETEAKSVSNEHTFGEDCDDRLAVRQVMVELAEHVGARLRADGIAGRVAHIKYRYDTFQTFTRQRAMEEPTSSDRGLVHAALSLLDAQTLERSIRLVGFGVSDLVEAGAPPGDAFLFPDMNPGRAREKDRRLDTAVDSIREKFGRGAVKRGKWK